MYSFLYKLFQAKCALVHTHFPDTRELYSKTHSCVQLSDRLASLMSERNSASSNKQTANLRDRVEGDRCMVIRQRENQMIIFVFQSRKMHKGVLYVWIMDDYCTLDDIISLSFCNQNYLSQSV